jgi:hypothetical protein
MKLDAVKMIPIIKLGSPAIDDGGMKLVLAHGIKRGNLRRSLLLRLWLFIVAYQNKARPVKWMFISLIFHHT